MQQKITIDQVIYQKDPIQGIDVFEIEWFEIHKQVFHRNTQSGIEIQLIKNQEQEWQQGDVLYHQGTAIAQIKIKPALTILFNSDHVAQVADFCFYIGNRHLPVFVDPISNAFYVPYDGNLYEQLQTKFKNQISLSKRPLFSSNLLKKQALF